MTRLPRPVLVGGILACAMLAFLLFMAMPTLGGREIRLPLEPVDPFDPLRGQYLALGYAINNPSRLPGLPKDLKEHQPVFVLLEEQATGVAVPVRASTSPLQAGGGQTVLRGRVEGGRIVYGIEAYFMERGASVDTRLTGALARVKVLPDGRASVVGLLKDGKPLPFTSRKRSFWEK